MKYLAFVTLLLAFTLNSCTTTMSFEEKSQWLMDYRRIAAKRVQRDFDAPHGIKDRYRKRIESDKGGKLSKKILKYLIFTEYTGHGLDSLMKMLVNADVRAMDEVYNGEEVRYWVKFYKSYEGKKLLKMQDQVDRDMDAEIAANPGKDPKPIVKRHNARFTNASRDAAHNFQAGVGQSLILKQDEFINTRYRYEVEARSRYNKRLINALYKLRKKMKNSRGRKTNSPE